MKIRSFFSAGRGGGYLLSLSLLIFTTVLSQWDFSRGKFGLLSPGKASCDRVALPSLRCMLGDFSVSIIHRTLTWTTGSLTCAQMLISIRLHTGGVRTHVRESALKNDCGRKIPCRTGESNRRQRRTGPMPYQWATSPTPLPPPPPETLDTMETLSVSCGKFGTDPTKFCGNFSSLLLLLLLSDSHSRRFDYLAAVPGVICVFPCHKPAGLMLSKGSLTRGMTLVLAVRTRARQADSDKSG